MLLLDPSLIPDPCLTAVQGKGAPDDIYLAFYTACTKLGMMYTDDARIMSLNVIHHHEPQVRETSGGKPGTLTSQRHMKATLQNLKI